MNDEPRAVNEEPAAVNGDAVAVAEDPDHTTCGSCDERVRTDRVNDDGVCVNCLVLRRRRRPDSEEN